MIFAGGRRPGHGGERLGFVLATSVEAAVAAARARLGGDATVVVMTMPPVFTVDVDPKT